VKGVLAGISEAMRSTAEDEMKCRLCTAASIDACNVSLNEGRVAVVPWCGDRACGDAIEEKTNASVLGTDVRSAYIPATEGACIICGKKGTATLVGRAY